ncbi:hypothetical protein ERO13_D13G129701v2 [Gossypium hirsutum]|nr:hypothetical protein ERO13_D13G129701v2 [Gossypium hirsutum]
MALVFYYLSPFLDPQNPQILFFYFSFPSISPMANTNLPQRIIKETQRLLNEPEDNMRYFNVIILGPTQSPYEGGVFKLELFLPEEYPMAAPKVVSIELFLMFNMIFMFWHLLGYA